MIFMLMVLVILVFAVLWNVDIHKILHLKSMTQNAGDASALMAARWQGITLNLVGDLNIMQAVAISENDSYTSGAISNIQARLLYTGPLVGLVASQQAAKNNGMYRNEEFEQRLKDHAMRVRYDYTNYVNEHGEILFPEPYENAWMEYADMLDAARESGICAGPDNVKYYTDRPASAGHMLLEQTFYFAVDGQDWCWFYRNCYDVLQDYGDYNDWPPLPEIIPNNHYINSEIFGVGLKTIYTTLSDISGDPAGFMTYLDEMAADRSLGTITNGMDTNAVWYCFNEETWTDWSVMDANGPENFPITGIVKEQYNYLGADAAVRIYASGLTLLTPNQEAPDVIWSAAAKPFGYLNDTDRPDSAVVVLPAFHQVAMIPVDACSGPSGGTYDLEWREHIENHLDGYVAHGPGSVDDCYYCAQLDEWEDDSFRQFGITWLSSNSWVCTIQGLTGGHQGGGTSRGH